MREATRQRDRLTAKVIEAARKWKAAADGIPGPNENQAILRVAAAGRELRGAVSALEALPDGAKEILGTRGGEGADLYDLDDGSGNDEAADRNNGPEPREP